MTDRVQQALSRLRVFFHKQTLDHEFDAKMTAHLKIAIEENVQRGLSPEEARHQALVSFGGLEQAKERHRETRGLPALDVLGQDLRYAFRTLRRDRVFSMIAVLILGLGIGTNVAVFSVVNTVLLQPYPFRDPGRIVVWRESIREIQNTAPLLPDNYRHYQNLRTHASSIQDAAIIQNPPFSISTGIDHPQMTEGLAVSPNFFSVLGVLPFLGRPFAEEEAQSGKDRVIILSWGAWQRLFHGSPSVVGSTLLPVQEDIDANKLLFRLNLNCYFSLLNDLFRQ